MAIFLYRYVSDAEKKDIDATGVIRSWAGVTYFTPDRYDDPLEAQRRLALPKRPDWRVGAIPASQMPDFDTLPIQTVNPGFGQPGGGTQCATSREVHLFAITRL